MTLHEVASHLRGMASMVERGEVKSFFLAWGGLGTEMKLRFRPDIGAVEENAVREESDARALLASVGISGEAADDLFEKSHQVAMRDSREELAKILVDQGADPDEFVEMMRKAKAKKKDTPL